MNKLFRNIALIFMAAVALTACQQDIVETGNDNVPDGYVRISTTLQVPDMKTVSTRAVDPDGKGIHSMTLFCFDNFGLFISYASSGGTGTGNVQITPDAANAEGYSLSGTIATAMVPENTRRIHFVANQNMASFKETDFIGLHEQEVMTKLQGSSGMMIYWGRYVAPSSVTSGSQLATVMNNNTTVKLLRNQARFTVAVADGSGYDADFVQGFTVVNTSAYGTVAPWHPEKGFDFTVEGNDSDWHTTNFITLPNNDQRLTPPSDVDAADDTCVFETKNNSAQPVSVIIKGKDNKYYRVMVVANNDYVDIRRNHHYIITISGALSYGVDSFAEALTAPATNNVWISIVDEVNEVQNSEWVLGVDETSIVVIQESDGSFVKPTTEGVYNLTGNNNGTLEIGYHLKRVDGSTTGTENAPKISWVGENSVAQSSIVNDFQNNGDGLLKVSLKELATDTHKQEGTILVEKGLLQRKIKVIVIRRQEFKPMWVTTQMYGGNNSTSATEFDGSNVTVMFTIPESCPDELLPLEVYISVDHLDVRSESGVSLPVIRNNDPRYGDDIKLHPNDSSNDEVIGYKYVYTATEKGDQRVYFKNILDQTTVTQHAGHQQYVTVESPYFEDLAKPFVFSNDNHKREITITNLKRYNAFASTGSATEYVYYMLVPQKKGAPIEFDVQLQDNGSPINANQSNDDSVEGFDEFLLYSEYIDHDDHVADSPNCYADFHSISAGQYGTNTRTFGMRMHKDPTTVGTATNIYPILMHTNRAKSAEVVRIASNQVNSPVVWSENAKKDGSGNYTGNTYKSVIFELSNYRPFRFAAQVKFGDGAYVGSFVDHDADNSNVDVAQAVQLSYQPAQKVKVAFDITHFAADIQDTSLPEAERHPDIHPFGRKFRVYIDAPMLEWDTDDAVYTALQNVGKIGTEGGKFYYVVDADRTAESTFWKELNIDGTTTLHSDDTQRREGERKVLPFKTKSNNIVVDNKIVITSEIEEVVYDEAVFNVSNAPITGTITYGADDSNQSNVPAGAFVVFELTRNNSRIGSLSVGDNGEYTLKLRPEYDFNWSDDEFEITYENSGNYYSKKYNGLNSLFTSPDIKLIKE